VIAPGSVDAPAKINLTLEVLGRQPDGYHQLRSVMVPIAIFDRIAWKPSARFSFTSDDPALQSNNLVERALLAVGGGELPIDVHLQKGIPVGGGLGGGSSDAAAILRAAMRGAFGDVGEIDWIAAARALGSDVPFFLIDGPALVEGTGERLTGLGGAPGWWLCLLVPNAAVATGDAYARLDAARPHSKRANRAGSRSLRLGEALQRADFSAVQALLSNDFEAVIAAAYPPIRAALDVLREAGASRPMLSGSGACVFALCRTEGEARAIARRLPAAENARARVVAFAGSCAWAASR
jgi:4-diphosphocytidyl-2-C-methyl-D-erythritol kinase